MTSISSEAPKKTAFAKELQWKETKLQDKCSDETTNKDHNGQKNNQSNITIEKGKTTKVNKSMSSRLDDSQLHTQLSMNLWKRLNAGYLVPSRPQIGVYKSTYTYDPTMVEKKSLEFHRKRDFYSEYNEVAARFKLVLGNKKPLSKKKDSGKDSNNKKISTPSSIENDGEKLQSDLPTNTTTNNEN